MENIDYRELFYEAAKEWDKDHKPKHLGEGFIKMIKDLRTERELDRIYKETV